MHNSRDVAAELIDRFMILEPALHQDYDLVLTILTLDSEGCHIAGPQGLKLLGGPLDILRPYVTAIVKDQILGAAGDNDLAVQPVAHVAGIENTIEAQGRAYEVTVLLDACRAIDLGGSLDAALAQMRQAGVELVNAGSA